MIIHDIDILKSVFFLHRAETHCAFQTDKRWCSQGSCSHLPENFVCEAVSYLCLVFGFKQSIAYWVIHHYSYLSLEENKSVIGFASPITDLFS